MPTCSGEGADRMSRWGPTGALSLSLPLAASPRRQEEGWWEGIGRQGFGEGERGIGGRCEDGGWKEGLRR